MASSTVANPVSFVEHKHMRFLISDSVSPPLLPAPVFPTRIGVQPTSKNVDAYVREFREHHVVELVRACDPTYPTDRLKAAGIEVHEMAYPDGDPPPEHVVDAWLALCDKTFKDNNKEKKTIAVHCIAGLGRAPVLVAIALIESGMEAEDAIDHIRARRSYAFNTRQVSYLLEDYKRRRRGGRCCVQ
jgi:protein tyrosine phosphatase type IVA